MVKAPENDERQGDWSVRMRVRNIDQDPDSLHQRIIADDDLGFTQAIIAQRQGCAQSTVSQVLAAERLRRLRNVREWPPRGRTGQRGSRIRERRGEAAEGRPAAFRAGCAGLGSADALLG